MTTTPRPGTLDAYIYDEVVKRNCYKLPAAFTGADHIIDIGAHRGYFAQACLQRGAGNIDCYEPDAENFRLLCGQLEMYPVPKYYGHMAVWRSDVQAHKLPYSGYFDAGHVVNTGAGSCLIAPRDTAADDSAAGDTATGNTQVPAVPFDDIITEKMRHTGGRRVRLVKLDCEGAEFPILLTSRTLDHIEEIVGEYHEYGGEYDKLAIPEHAHVAGYERFTESVLKEHLRAHGFSVETSRMGKERLGMFWAKRG